jgi:ketosteroid isomerase-like protein
MGEREMALLHEVFTDWEAGNFRRTDYFDPDFEVVFARDFLDEGVFHGPDEATRGWRMWLAQWASWRVVALDYTDLHDGRICVRIRVEGISKSTGVKLQQESGNLFEFRDGRPYRITLYTRYETLSEDLARL